MKVLSSELNISVVPLTAALHPLLVFANHETKYAL